MLNPDLKDRLKLVQDNEIPDRFVPSVGEIIAQYRIEKLLGEGSFGLVYKVVDNQTGEIHALKLLKLWEVLKDERLPIIQRFLGEFKCGLIDSKYLVKSTDFGKIRGNPFIVMNFCGKGDLRNIIGQNISIPKLGKYAIEVLLGLKSLHSEGIVHRDLKPENVLIDDDDTAHLTDFGIAGFTNARMTKKNIFGHAMGIFGTYAYMPPEQLNPKISFKTMSPATDVYSFGAMFYEMFSGKLPFGKLESESDLPQYVMRANKGEWDDIRKYCPDIPYIWIKIIEGCLEPKYEKRLQDVNTIISMLGYDQTHEVSSVTFDFNKQRIGIQVMKGEEHGHIYNLSAMVKNDDGILTIGWQDPNCLNKNDIGILEMGTSYISNFHATIEKISSLKKWYIRDGQWREKNGKMNWYPSTNGVFVNSKQAGTEGFELFPDDIITIGDTTLKVILIDN